MIPPYPAVLEDTKKVGTWQTSQHGQTMECLLTQVISDPGEMIRRTNINYSIGYMEALQIIAGVYNIQAMVEVAPNASHKLFTLPMAYGPRLAVQMPRIVEKLRSDPDTRQAIAFIGKPEDGATNEQPCTTTLQWLYRGGQLVCIASMRSLDLIKGLPYDLMMFHAMTMTLAHCLEANPGPVCLTAASAHIYQQDLDREAVNSSGRVMSLAGGLPREWREIQAIAQEQVVDRSVWRKADGMKHVIPPLFEETFTPQN